MSADFCNTCFYINLSVLSYRNLQSLKYNIGGGGTVRLGLGPLRVVWSCAFT